MTSLAFTIILYFDSSMIQTKERRLDCPNKVKTIEMAQPTKKKKKLKLLTFQPLPTNTSTKANDKESNRDHQTNDEPSVKRRQKLSKKLTGWKDVLSDEISHTGVVANLLELLRSLMPAIETQAEKHSSLGRLSRLQDALKLLHVADKTTELTDQLMLPIRQLVTTQVRAFGVESVTIASLLLIYINPK